MVDVVVFVVFVVIVVVAVSYHLAAVLGALTFAVEKVVLSCCCCFMLLLNGYKLYK